jgi:hypothetical protein
MVTSPSLASPGPSFALPRSKPVSVRGVVSEIVGTISIVRSSILMILQGRWGCFAHHGRPNSTHDDSLFPHGADDFSTAKDQFPPTVLPKFVKPTTRFGVHEKNFGPVENAISDARSGLIIPAGDIPHDCLDVRRGTFNP